MSKVVTAEELLTISDTKGCRHKLVAGELRKKELNGWRHGIVANNVALILGSHIFENRLGLMLAGGTGFLLHQEPDTVLAPDFAFIANENTKKGTIGHCYWPGAPDLAVEVLSPGDTCGEVAEKVSEWLECGCAAV
jgi:Uma2 family endonuclease